ncbi:azurin [Neisseria sp.]|uniref:azurin n=1 Tax=Neisseria sp. TaxID=192066 RepID=UPI0035A10E14
MKTYLALISAAVIGLSACSQESKTAAPASSAPAAASAEAASSAPSSAPAASEPAAPAASAPASSAAAPAAAGNCEVTVDSNDQMQFNTKDLKLSKACKEVTVKLTHSGTMPKAGMGHNIVISKTEDVDAVLKDGATAGMDADYVKAGDSRVVAYTKLIGGGESAELKVDPAKLADGKYEFFCSFPGHIAMMRGSVTLVD